MDFDADFYQRNPVSGVKKLQDFDTNFLQR